MTTLPERKHEQNPAVVVTIHIANANNTTMRHGDPHYSDLLRYFCIVLSIQIN